MKITKTKLKFSLMAFLFACGALLSTVLFWESSAGLSIVLIYIAILIFIVWGFEKNIKIYILSMLIGLVSESVMASFGVCKYASPDFFGSPYWIPFFWGIIGLLIVNTCKKLSTPYYYE